MANDWQSHYDRMDADLLSRTPNLMRSLREQEAIARNDFHAARNALEEARKRYYQAMDAWKATEDRLRGAE
jgi:hypothetical protein